MHSPTNQNLRYHFLLLLWKYVALGGAIFGALLFASFTVMMIISAAKGDLSAHDAASFIPFSLFLSFAFSLYLQRELNNARETKELKLEQAILGYAASQNNRALSIPEISLNCGISLKRITDTLNQMSQEGICKIDVDDSGQLIYSFSNLPHRNIIGTHQEYIHPLE